MALENLGEHIRTIRKERGLSQEALARSADVSLNLVGKLELGLVLNPHYGTLAGLARALGVTVEELVEEPVLVGPKADAPKTGPEAPHREQASSESLMSRPEVRGWMRARSHMDREDFLSWARECKDEEDIERAIEGLHTTRDALLESLKDQEIQAALFGGPQPEGLTGDARYREVFRPGKAAWKLRNEIQREYSAREISLVNYSRVLFAEGKAEDYFVRGPIREKDHERHQQLLEARRVLEESYEKALAL